jgi:hypothetical protein
MKTWILVFAIALGLAAVLVVAAGWTEQPQAPSFDHPKFAGMQQSGVDAEPDAALLWIGWSFGALQIGFFAAMLALGARSRRGLRGLGLPLIAASLVYLAIWSALVLAYRSQTNAEDPVLFLGFPAPTAWMLFALWPCPLIFTFYYVVGFDRWIATPEDLAELEQTLERLRAEPGSPNEEIDR